MNKLLLVFKSRTFWTTVVLFLVNGITAIKGVIPMSILPYVDGVLGLLIVWFHINPSQNYDQ